MVTVNLMVAVLFIVIVNRATGFEDSYFYPCSWVGKTFKISSGNTTVGVWDFDFTGKGSMLEIFGEVLQLECVRIEGQFIILRKIGTSMTSCMSIYNITGDAFKLYYRDIYEHIPTKFLVKPNILCDVCRDFVPYIARVNGYSDDKLSSRPYCLYPKGCSVPDITTICNENIEKKIDEGTCDRTPPEMPMMMNM